MLKFQNIKKKKVFKCIPIKAGEETGREEEGKKLEHFRTFFNDDFSASVVQFKFISDFFLLIL
jgi:hypothetical protein